MREDLEALVGVVELLDHVLDGLRELDEALAVDVEEHDVILLLLALVVEFLALGEGAAEKLVELLELALECEEEGFDLVEGQLKVAGEGDVVLVAQLERAEVRCDVDLAEGWEAAAKVDLLEVLGRGSVVLLLLGLFSRKLPFSIRVIDQFLYHDYLLFLIISVQKGQRYTRAFL